MRVKANRIELGVSEVDGEIVPAPDEVDQITAVLGKDIESALQPTIKKRRETCGKPNCCLTIDVLGVELSEEDYDSLQERHIETRFPVLGVIFSCAKDTIKCKGRVASNLTHVEEVLADAKRRWQKGEEKADLYTQAGLETAQEIQAKADQEIGNARFRAQTLADNERLREYTSLRCELEEGL